MEGSIHKCPNCGEIIKSFTANCPSCGLEFRDLESVSSTKRLEIELKKIDSKRKGSSKSTLADVFHHAYRGDSITEQKISLIRSFAIPNTKEDLFEFMVLAVSNIEDFENNKSTDEQKLSRAWKAKAEQAYNKAKLSFGNDRDFERIQQLYDEKKGKIRAAEKKSRKVVFWFLLLYMGGLALLFAMAGFSSLREKKQEEKLNKIVKEIQEDIEDGKYDEALMKANELRFDEDFSNSKSKAAKWDETREYWIEYIKQQKKEHFWDFLKQKEK